MVGLAKIGASKNFVPPPQNVLSPLSLDINELDLVARPGSGFMVVFAGVDGLGIDNSTDLLGINYSTNLNAGVLRVLHEGNPSTDPSSSFYQIKNPDVSVLSDGRVLVAFDSGQTGTSSQATGTQRGFLNLSTSTLSSVADFPLYTDTFVRSVEALDNGGMVFAVGSGAFFFFATDIVFANANGTLRKSIDYHGDFAALDSFRVAALESIEYANVNESSISAHIYTVNGTRLTTLPSLIEQSQIYTAANQKDYYDVQLSALKSQGQGHYVATWTSFYYNTPSQPDTKFTMRLMDDSGGMISKLITVSTGDGDDISGYIQLEGFLALPNGGFLIAYEKVSGGNYHVYVRAYDALGTAYGNELQLDTNAYSQGGGTGSRGVKFVQAEDGKIFVAYNDADGTLASKHIELQQLGMVENAAPVYGTDAGATYNGNASANVYFAESGNDVVNGLGGADILFGQTGNDTIDGGYGADRIMGGKGRDIMSAGDGAGVDEDGSKDTFVFFDLGETGNTATTCDVISKFGRGTATTRDVIDLSAIDANNTRAGNHAFIFESDGTFDAGQRGQVIVVQQGADCLIKIDFDGVTSTVEAMILVQGITSMTASDFIL